MTPELSQFHSRTIIRVSIVSATVNTLLALLKIIIGTVGHSQALIADGVHSFSDLLTDGLVLVSARMGAQSPDQDHPYGHRRIETVSAIVISISLIVVAFGIAYHTLHLSLNATLQKPDNWVALIAAISIVSNEALYRYGLKYGNVLNSDLLRTNAWHNRSDAMVSFIVLLSVIGSMLGIPHLDSLGALIISALILKMGLKMTWTSIKELIDTAVDEKTLKCITQNILNTSGVVAIHQLRTRFHGSTIFIDVHIQVNPHISVSEGHYISEQVRLNLTSKVDHIADVTVHIDPEDDEDAHPSCHLPDRKVLNTLLTIHCQHLPGYSHIRQTLLHYLNGKLHIEIYFTVTLLEEGVNLEQLKTLYEKAVKNIDNVSEVTLCLK